MKGFGIVCQYYKEEELATYQPDMWALVKQIGATMISGPVRKWVADGCRERGLTVNMHYTGPPRDIYDDSLPIYWKASTPLETAKQSLKTHLDGYDIAQYKNHEGVFCHELTGEPLSGMGAFDPRKPTADMLKLVEVCKYGCDYIRSLDPTHPVTVALNPAGVYGEQGTNFDWGVNRDKRKAFINLFMPFCDILNYHYYMPRDHGTNFSKNPEKFRSWLVRQLDDVLIPCAAGKSIVIGECGMPSGPFKDYTGTVWTSTEEIQRDYFRMYGEETKKRKIFVIPFKLIDGSAFEVNYSNYGLFRPAVVNGMNVAKLVASTIKEAIGLTELAPEPPTPTPPTPSPQPDVPSMEDFLALKQEVSKIGADLTELANTFPSIIDKINWLTEKTADLNANISSLSLQIADLWTAADSEATLKRLVELLTNKLNGTVNWT
jgi:hypothetical protein